MRFFGNVLTVVSTLALVVSAVAEPPSARQALQPLRGLVGTWKGTGIPQGRQEDQHKGFWIERISCEWQFKGQDAWLKLDFETGKQFKSGSLRALPSVGQYQLAIKTTAGAVHTYAGGLKDNVLTLQRHDADTSQDDKLVVTLLHENRFLYRFESREAGKKLFARQYQVGATKEGVPFAGGDGRPECIVSGGLGTIAVAYLGKTYYVCCSGCRDEFMEHPAQYVREHEAKHK